MKAAVLYERKTSLKVEDVDLDAPKAGEVLVKVAANGVCHSDYSVIHGVLPRLIDLYGQKKLKLDELVTRTYPLNDVNEAMTALEKGEVVRSVMVM